MKAIRFGMPLLGLLLALPTLSSAATKRPEACRGVREPVIDVHVHSYTADPRWTVRAPSPATGVALSAVGEEAHRAATIEEHRRNSVIRAIVDNDDEDLGDGNSAQRLVATAPHLYRLGIDVSQPTPEVLARIRELHSRGELTAIGEVGTQYHGLAPDDPRMEPLWALAEELDLPVGLHMGLGWPGVNEQMPKMRMRLGDPLLLEDVLVRHPRLRIFVMHAGWPHLDGMLAMLHSFPNLYVDVGVIDWAKPEAEFHAYLKRLVDSGFSDRILYGSDQMVWPDAVSISIGRIRTAPFLTRQQKRDILFNNAVRFFRWSDLQGC